MKKFFPLSLFFCVLLVCCSRNTPEVNSDETHQPRRSIVSTNAYTYYERLEDMRNETPYSYIMNKYLDIALEYLNGWEDSYPNTEITTKQEMINSYAINHPELDDIVMSETEFDDFFNQLYDSLCYELNTFSIVLQRIEECTSLFGIDCTSIDSLDMIIPLGGIGYSKLEILQAAEMDLPLWHESFDLEEEIANTDFDCDCNCEPAYVQQRNQTTPNRLNRYFLLSLWLTDIRYRNFRNSCPNMNRMREAMDEWENASNGAIHFREICDNGWNRFTWGIGCNYHVKLGLETDPLSGGHSSIAAVPWAHCYINNNQTKGTYLHELGHILGLQHEMTRPDRDCYIDIDWAHIKRGYEHNFHKYLCTSVRMYGDFDFESIMMYGSTDFSDYYPTPTMTKKDGTTFVANRSHLSDNDIHYIQYLYH